MGNTNDKPFNFKEFLKTDRAIRMICIGIALVFWFFLKMSNAYSSRVPIDVNFTLPEGKIFSNPPPQTIEVPLTASGWDLIGRSIRGRNQKVEIPLEGNELEIIVPNDMEKYFSEILGNQFKIRTNFMRTYSFNVDKKYYKKIALKLNKNIQTADQYQLTGPIRLDPDSVILSGPKKIIDEIDSWETEVLTALSLNEDTKSLVPLTTPSNSQIQVKPKEVTAIIGVEQFTQKDIYVPIQVINVPDSIQIIPLKKNVKISVVVGLSKYPQVSPDVFEAVLDFKDVDMEAMKSAPISIRQRPNFIDHYILSPENVEILVSKNEN